MAVAEPVRPTEAQCQQCGQHIMGWWRAMARRRGERGTTRRIRKYAGAAGWEPTGAAAGAGQPAGGNGAGACRQRGDGRSAREVQLRAELHGVGRVTSQAIFS